ncbi:3-oxoacyl-[acyl-carrier-protein] synthase III C-terminal domain-containing protein [Conexibacter arvalis]|uniref:Putative naringenin-chalcone synthase n=1 Tax=Conexibacter arvalis TaxID=912552 RepID=A0A840ICX4_9ACTN|nr:3-oxoacyl-[acyl-carrier-protein] synthase III C-terminal domain-containing protein [Conexibacter arvalis]MBB4661888.1 putative naringenin-chalcone synthase [Conexibacter arvalis]
MTLSAPAPADHRSATAPPRLAGLATAAPARVLDQDEMLDLLGLAGDPFATAIFDRCGVRRRHLDLTRETVATTLQERSPASELRLLELAEEAISQLDLDADRIGVVVTASIVSLGAPTLAHRLVDRLGLPSDVDKYHVLGVGCASAVPLLRLAGQALRDRPGEQALVVAAECMSGILTPVGPGDEKVKTIGSSLFGDGAAAALLALDGDEAEGETGGAPATLPTFAASAVHQLPGTLGDVRSAMTALDSQIQMSKALPVHAATRLGGLVDDFLARHGLTRAEIDHWPVHPGGRGILEGIHAGLGLTPEETAASAAVLAEYGNVGTPSAFFVLRELVERRRPQPGERGLMVTIGPGVTVGLALLEW